MIFKQGQDGLELLLSPASSFQVLGLQCNNCGLFVWFAFSNFNFYTFLFICEFGGYGRELAFAVSGGRS